jgi:hypothetical protein
MKNRIILAGTAALILLPMLAIAQDYPTPNKQPLVVVKDGKYGYIDHSGEVVTEPLFLWAGGNFEGGFAMGYICGRFVSVDESGKLVPFRPASYQKLQAKQQPGRKYGFVDASGQFRINGIFDNTMWFSEGLAAVCIGGLWGFIDSSGREVIPPLFKHAYYFREGVADVDTDNGIAIIDKTGTILASGFDRPYPEVAEGRVSVCRKSKCGYLDLRGNIAIPLIYDRALPLSCGLALVKKDEKWGYIDKDGHTAIPFIFDYADRFASGLAPARIGNETGFIDRSGKFAFHLAFRSAAPFLTHYFDGTFPAETDVAQFWTADGAFGYVNMAGRVIWGPTVGSPSPMPPNFLGWSEKDKVRSCERVPPAVRDLVAHFPKE